MKLARAMRPVSTKSFVTSPTLLQSHAGNHWSAQSQLSMQDEDPSLLLGDQEHPAAGGLLPDVFCPVLLAEAQIAIQTMANIVTVQKCRQHAPVVQSMLQSASHSRFS